MAVTIIIKTAAFTIENAEMLREMSTMLRTCSLLVRQIGVVFYLLYFWVMCGHSIVIRKVAQASQAFKVYVVNTWKRGD